MDLRSTCVDVAAAYLVSVGLCFAVLGCGPHVWNCFLVASRHRGFGGSQQVGAYPLSVDTALAQRQRALIAQVDLAASRFQLEAKRCCFC